MTSEQLYYNFHLLLNKNASLKNVRIAKPNFVILYNREASNWLADYIDKHSSTDDIHDIEGLLKVNKELELNNSFNTYYEYNLPEDYFTFVDSSSRAIQNKCEGVIYNYLQKPKEININLDYQLPSFKFEESICNITENKLRVYVDNYKLISTYLSYYVTPEKIDLEGYTNIDGSFSTNINTDLGDYYQWQILDRVVLEVFREFENTNQINISQTRINQ